MENFSSYASKLSEEFKVTDRFINNIFPFFARLWTLIENFETYDMGCTFVNLIIKGILFNCLGILVGFFL